MAKMVNIDTNEVLISCDHLEGKEGYCTACVCRDLINPTNIRIRALEGVVEAAKKLFIFIDDNVIWGDNYENTNPSATINNSVKLGYKFDDLRKALSDKEE